MDILACSLHASESGAWLSKCFIKVYSSILLSLEHGLASALLKYIPPYF